MTGGSAPVRGSIHFCFADPVGFSGQKAAAELVLNGLARRGWRCRRLPQPVFERGGGPVAALRYLWRVSTAWVRASQLLVARGGWLWVGLGQTRTAFLRDAVPLFLGRLGLGRSRVIVSLNGSVFMQWADDSLDAKMFRFLLGQAGRITVVGEKQRERLLGLGLPDDRVKVVVNSCELESASAASVAAKHAVRADEKSPVRCLHLSSLIDTKGFPEFLEALLQLSIYPGPRVEAVLCGRLVASEFSNRFRNDAAAEAWIEKQMAEINRTSRISVRWIKGAAGAEKAALFREADVFVLPTRYAVEAQPLVLLEAMASGCAIVTTRAGEIPTILDKTCAVFLNTTETAALTSLLQRLISDPAARGTLGRAAHARFVERYQPERHLDLWETLLDPSGVRRAGS